MPYYDQAYGGGFSGRYSNYGGINLPGYRGNLAGYGGGHRQYAHRNGERRSPVCEKGRRPFMAYPGRRHEGRDGRPKAHNPRPPTWEDILYGAERKDRGHDRHDAHRANHRHDHNAHRGPQYGNQEDLMRIASSEMKEVERWIRAISQFKRSFTHKMGEARRLWKQGMHFEARKYFADADNEWRQWEKKFK